MQGKAPELPFSSKRFFLVLFSSLFGSLVLFSVFLLVLQVLSGCIHLKIRDTHRPNIMNYLPLATLSCLPEQCNNCGKNLSRKSSLSKYMLVVHGASRPSIILQIRYLARLITQRRISFAICYITRDVCTSAKPNLGPTDRHTPAAKRGRRPLHGRTAPMKPVSTELP